jgi:hypothetical protein
MTPPKAGETWLGNNESSELTILGYDEVSGEVWVRFFNTGESKVYARNRWERWVKKPEYALPSAPRCIFFVFRSNSSGQLIHTTTITDMSPNWRTRLKPYLRPGGNRYRVTLLRQSARHGSPGRYDWYTADDFQDDYEDDEDDDC